MNESSKAFTVLIRESSLLLFWATLVFLIYSNTLSSPFVFDDRPLIQHNPHIRLSKITCEEIKKAGFNKLALQRPIPNISFALNYYFHRYNPAGYHLVNILIHIATGILLYYFMATTLSLQPLQSLRENYQWLSFFAVSIWLVHPLQTQSVTYLVQRMNSLAALFYVSALLFYAKARLSETKRYKVPMFAGCILSGLLAFGSKENTATLPLFILLYEWFFFQDLSRLRLKRHIFSFIGIGVVFIWVALIYTRFQPLQMLLSGYQIRDFTLIQRVLTEFRVVMFYISLLIVPHPTRLNLDHDFYISQSFLEPITTLLSIGTIVGLIALAIYLARKERLLSFCILWFFGNLVIESSVVGLEIIFEHRTYLPSMFICLMAVTLAHRLVNPQWLKISAWCLIVILFSVWTYERNKVWSSNVALWQDCVAKSPGKVRPHNNLGLVLALDGRLDEAIGYYSAALDIKPDAEVHCSLSAALKSQGRFEEAADHCYAALKIRPDYVEAHNNLGSALEGLGRFEEAVGHFAEALRIKPDYVEAHNNLGLVLVKTGNVAEAIRHYNEAIRIDPGNAATHFNMGTAQAKQENHQEAVNHFSAALRNKPDYAEAHNSLGIVLAKQGNHQEAANHFSAALRIKPDYAQAHNNLGIVLVKQGKITEGIRHFSAALGIEPDYADARKNLNLGLQLMNQSKSALNSAEKTS